jgi:hypothetical protein
MKITKILAATLGILCAGSDTSLAAAKKQRSYEDCSKLANERGFTPNERGSTRRIFIEQCMKGAVS